MTNAVFSISKDLKNHDKLISNFLKEHNIDNIIINSLDTGNEIFYVINNEKLNRNKIINEIEFIMEKEEEKWFGKLK